MLTVYCDLKFMSEFDHSTVDTAVKLKLIKLSLVYVSRDHFSHCLHMSSYCESTIPFTLVDTDSPHWPNS